MKKTTKKNEKSMRIVNLIDIQSAGDVRWRFTYAKCANKEPITIDELADYGETIMDATLEAALSVHIATEQLESVLSKCNCDTCKQVAEPEAKVKNPWYKRFWNWLTRKK